MLRALTVQVHPRSIHPFAVLPTSTQMGRSSIFSMQDSASSTKSSARQPAYGLHINSLPPEIISKILEACLPLPLLHGCHPIQPMSTRNKRHVPILLVLSQVCSLWRGVAFSTPSLWNNLEYDVVVVYSMDEDDNKLLKCDEGKPTWLSFRKTDVDILSWWARKVKGDSLTLKLSLDWRLDSDSSDLLTLDDHFRSKDALHSGYAGRSSEDEAHVAAIAPMLGLISRARHLEIDGWFFKIFTHFFNGTSGTGEPVTDFPNLEYLSTGETDWPDDIFLQDFEVIPVRRMSRLRTIHLNNYVVQDRVPYQASGFWGQLTHLSAYLKIGFADWHLLLKACTSLKVASIALNLDDEPDSSPPFSSSPVDLPNLHRLEITRVDYGTPGVLFDGFHFPCLKTFIMNGPYLSMESLHRLLRATPELKNLRISTLFPSVTTAQEDELLLLTGDIDLIGHVRFPEMDAFTLGPQVGQERKYRPLSSYVPKLEVLGLDLPVLYPVHPGSFTSFADGMLKCGWLTGSSRLKHVTFYVAPQDGSQRRVLKSLKELHAYVDRWNADGYSFDDMSSSFSISVIKLS